MKTDYSYCQTKTCIHRRGCKRWIGNYTEEEQLELLVNPRAGFVDNTFCEAISVDVTIPYKLLDRFRNSNGSEIE